MEGELELALASENQYCSIHFVDLIKSSLVM
jgi:hypothetical protein